jgi:hypothetical protein
VAEPSLRAQPVYCRRQEVVAQVESADHERGWAEKPSSVGVDPLGLGGGPQARQHPGRVTQRVGICVDREYARILGVGVAQPTGGVNQDLSRFRARVNPPRARGDEPEEIDMQVVIARRPGSLRGGYQRGEPPDVAERPRQRGLFNPRDSRAVQLPEVKLVHLPQQRHHHIGSPDLDGDPGSGEQAPAAARRFPEFGGAPHRGYCDRARAPLSRPRACRFEVGRDVLMLTGEQGRTVPCTPVLILQDIRQGFMGAPPVRQACALRDSRADERMSEAERVKVDVDNAGIGRRLSGVEIQGCPGDGAGRLEDLAYGVVVAQRGDQQHKARGVGQVRYAGREGTLEALGQRQAARHRLIVLGLAGRRWQLEERERIAGGLAEDAAARGKREAWGHCVEQSRGGRVVEAGKPVLRQPRIGECRGVPVTRAGQQQNRVGLNPPGNKGEYVCSGGVEPVSVLDDQQQRGVGSDLRDEVERGHRNPVMLRCDFACQAERGIEGGTLDGRQLDRALAYGPEHLVQPGKWQMRFGLHASCSQHGHSPVACSTRGLRQQPRLADARLAAKHERLAAGRHLVQERSQKPLFLGAAE